MIRTEDDAIHAILDLWDAAGLEMPKRQRELIEIAGETGYALAGSVLTRINDALANTQPTTDGSRLLARIDEHYVQRVQKQRSQRSKSPRSRIVEVIQLISPLVHFDEIIAMRSFDDDYLSRMELAFLSWLDVPRNLEEAERVFAKILELPHSFVRRNAMGRLSSDQPFRAQMFFANLLRRETEPDGELGQFLKHCLESCPDYLLDIPDKPMSLEYSSRPAFWLSRVDDPILREILLERGSESVRDSINRRREYSRKQEACASAVRSETTTTPPLLPERVSIEQEELAALLTTFEEQVNRDLPMLATTWAQPVQDDQIEKLNRAIGPLRLTEDVETLYKWRNGFRSEIRLFDFPDVVPIELALHEYRQLAEVLDETWSSAWFPLCGRGRSFRLTLLSEDYAPSTPVFDYDIEDGELQLAFESLESMVQTYKDAYETGISTYDDSVEHFRFDRDALEKLRLTANPRAYSYPDKRQNMYSVWEPGSWPPLWRKYKVRK